MRYREGQLPEQTGTPVPQTDDFVALTVWLTLIIGVVFVVGGFYGRQRWLIIWGEPRPWSIKLVLQSGVPIFAHLIDNLFQIRSVVTSWDFQVSITMMKRDMPTISTGIMIRELVGICRVIRLG